MKQRAAGLAPAEKVIVAVRAGKVISKTALAWALTHVAHPGDCITLLALLPAQKTGRRSPWSLARLSGDCGTDEGNSLPERISRISQSCSQMALQLHDQIEVRVQIKVVLDSPSGVVAAEGKSNAASWVVLDKNLKQEQKHCLDELHCNIVVMQGSQPKVLRLNLRSSDEAEDPSFSASSSSPDLDVGKLQQQRMKHCTPVSSPDEPSTSYTRTTENSISSSDTEASPFLVYEQNPLFEGPNKRKCSPKIKRHNLNDFLKDLVADGENAGMLLKRKSSFTRSLKALFWIRQNNVANEKPPASVNYRDMLSSKSPTIVSHRTLLDRFKQFNHDTIVGPEISQPYVRDYHFNSTIRNAVSLGKTSSLPPPLCSSCQHIAPAFGKPPKRFGYKELEEATDRFSDLNFLAEGGFGTVHRGVLRDGQMVAVKQLKFAGSQGDADFCREVRVLSCAQHINVVLLIGFCAEGKNRIIVYEYICNGSLDFHLHGNKRSILDWQSRQKIAIGAARGLRYLHEDCRVGSILHRDLRPSNILLTHDYEPLVADFGLATLHREWDICERVVGTAGYLAPEYINGGKITEKVDIYAFGLVLLELITGEKARNLLYNGQHLGESCPPFISPSPDPIGSLFTSGLNKLPQEVHTMGHAAFLCLQQDPDLRPTISKVLRILEGRCMVPIGADENAVGSRSAHMTGLSSKAQFRPMRHSRKLSQ